MYFVIWGAGEYGKKLLKMMGYSRVLAFIDSDECKIGTEYMGIEVISFESFANLYYGEVIVVSPFVNDDICAFLDEHYPFYVSYHKPGLQSKFDTEPLDNIVNFNLENMNTDDGIVIYGFCLLTFLILTYLDGNGYKHIYIDDKNAVNFLKKIWDRYPQYKTLGKFHVRHTIVTNKYLEQAMSYYPNTQIVDLWDNAYVTKTYDNPKLKQFYLKHKNETLVIVGTAPSLSIADLEKLYGIGVTCMSVNMIYRSFEYTHWRPDYYVVVDPHAISQYGDEIKQIQLPVKFISDHYQPFWNDSNIDESLYKFHVILDFNEGLPRFSDSIDRGIYTRGTVVYTCLQIAIYMGFNKIILVGVECNYKGVTQNCQNHFCANYFSKEDNTPNIVFDQKGAFEAMQVAMIYAKRHNVEIYNATRGGLLEVFPRINFDDFVDSFTRG